MFLFYVSILPACMYVYHLVPGSLGVLKRPSDRLGLELRMVGSVCGFWKPNLGPPQEQEVLLTTEPFHQPMLSSLIYTH